MIKIIFYLFMRELILNSQTVYKGVAFKHKPTLTGNTKIIQRTEN